LIWPWRAASSPILETGTDCAWARLCREAGKEDEAVTTDVTGQAGPAPSAQGELSAGAFRRLLDAFAQIRVPLAPDEARAAAERRREEIRQMIEGHTNDPEWRELLHQAREAAERGEHEYLLLRFPAFACTDHGRAIVEQNPGWADTLTGDAAAIYRHWREDLQLRGFQLTARILGFSGGRPGDAGLFLTWRE
jgi:hypothetical protein